MAGPTAAVLFSTTLTHERVAMIRDDIGRRAAEVIGDDFWVYGRPFIVSIGPEYADQLPEVAASGLPAVLGWVPQDIVTFAAMCNSDQDHGLLAELCIALAERHAGLISFGGCLAIGPRLNDSAPSTPVRVENPGGTQGVLYAATYEAVSGSFATTHYGDVTLARSWVQHPRFHMVK